MIWPDFLRSQLHRTLYDSPRHFAVAGSLEQHSFTHITLAQVGPVTLPLRSAQLQALGALSHQNDISTIQIDAHHIQLSIEHQSFVSELTREVVARLDVSPFGVRAKLDKLVIHGEHGHCKPNKQTEPHPDAFATLIVQLPTVYHGGQLQIRHHQQTQTFDMTNCSRSKLHWALFFSHCEYERLPVTSGHCVSLIFNVHRSAPGMLPTFDSRCDTSHMLIEAAALWRAMPSKLRPKMLAIPLEHYYKPDQLSFANLQGVDAVRANKLRTSVEYIMFLVLVEKDDLGVLPKDPGGRYVYNSPSGEDAVQNRNTFSPIHQMKEVQESSERITKFVKENNRHLHQIYLDELLEDKAISDKKYYLREKGLFDDSKPHAESYDPFLARVMPPLTFSYREAALIFWPRAFHADFFCSLSFDMGVKYVVQAFENKDADAQSLLEQLLAYGKDNDLKGKEGAVRMLNFACKVKDENVAVCALEFMTRVERDLAFEKAFPICEEDAGCSSSAHSSSFLKAIDIFNWERIRGPMLAAIRATPSECFGYCLSLAHRLPNESRLSQARKDIQKTLALAVCSKSLSERDMPEAVNVLFSFSHLRAQQEKMERIFEAYRVERMALFLEELHALIVADGVECGAAVAFARMVPMFISKEFGASAQASRRGCKDKLKSHASMYRARDRGKDLRYSRSSALVFSLLVDERILNEELLRQFIDGALSSRRKKLVSILVQLIPSETSTNQNVNALFESLRSFQDLDPPE